MPEPIDTKDDKIDSSKEMIIEVAVHEISAGDLSKKHYQRCNLMPCKSLNDVVFSGTFEQCVIPVAIMEKIKADGGSLINCRILLPWPEPKPKPEPPKFLNLIDPETPPDVINVDGCEYVFRQILPIPKKEEKPVDSPIESTDMIR